jgi:hypothetical protein
LAVDATVSESKQVFDWKISKISEMLKEKNGVHIEYFLSESSGRAGKLDNLPAVVIGVDKESTRDLSEILYDRIYCHGEKRKNANQELAGSSLSISVIKEIIFQLSEQLKILKTIGKESQAIYSNTLGIRDYLEKLLPQKKGPYKDRPNKTPLVYHLENYNL